MSVPVPSLARAVVRAALLVGLLGLPPIARAQQLAATRGPTPVTKVRSAQATRADHAPVIDGRNDDAVWQMAPVITAFRQFVPTEDGDPQFRTAAQFAYDGANLYVFVRMFDPHPDSIVSLLSRRDVKTPSDQIKVMLDSYHDRRNGYEFAVNPAGVKRDYAMYNDQTEDGSWDGVWDAATRIDSLGWTAEFRIPFSQLRFPKARDHTFGISIWRDIARTNERDSWPLFRQSQPGIVSQLGELTGIIGIGTPLRLEVAPYVVTKNVSTTTATGFARDQQISAGADLKYGVSSNLTLDATFNPDFGQVEADPSVLNLTAFESFFEEKRPFFLEGAGIFQCDGACESLFYSRRIGREPQLRSSDADPASSTILGAAKLTGRTAHGLSIGVLDAVTQRERGGNGATIEPGTNYFAGRVQQDFRNGLSGVGLMLTGVHRSLDATTTDVLRRDAYAALLNAHHRFLGGRYELTGYVGGSVVAGSDSAIARTQRSSVHFYQRPGTTVAYDPSRTRLAGDLESLTFGKVGGGVVRFSTTVRHTAPGVEVNDLGFLSSVDQQTVNGFVGLQFNRPRYFYRFASLSLSAAYGATTGGLRTSRGVGLSAGTQLTNNWNAFASFFANAIGSTYCVSCTRGGPVFRVSPAQSAFLSIGGDSRHAVTPSLGVSGSWQRASGSFTWSVSPGLNMRASTRFSMSLGPFVSRNIDDAQWHGNITDDSGITHYTFAHLDQTTVGITTRVNVTATPNLSFELYAEPFVSAGRYADVRELADPRAVSYADRFRPYYERDSTGALVRPDPGSFNVKQFRSNAVLRWEYRPGSALFVVWTQERDQGGLGTGTFDFRRDYGDLFRARPDNTFLIKLSYWFSP